MSKKKGASGGLMPGGNFLKLVPLDYILPHCVPAFALAAL